MYIIKVASYFPMRSHQYAKKAFFLTLSKSQSYCQLHRIVWQAIVY